MDPYIAAVLARPGCEQAILAAAADGRLAVGYTRLQLSPPWRRRAAAALLTAGHAAQARMRLSVPWTHVSLPSHRC